jgi:predicted amidohydrolase YtcJ
MSADIVLKNARVITMDSAYFRAAAVAVKGGVIHAVGSDADVEAAAGPGTRTIDCQGRAVVPGFNDAHLHLFSLMRMLLGIDVSPAAVRSILDIKDAIFKRASVTPPGRWLSGHGFNEFYLAERRFPNRHDLDEAAPHHPVVLSHRSLHACVLNNRALELAGIGPETPEPPGARIERDLSTGEPNGILYEMLGYIREKVMPPVSGKEMAEGIKMADRLFLSHGITSIQEASVSNDMRRWDMVKDFIASGRLRCRVSLMAGAPAWRRFKDAGMKTGAGDGRLQLGAVKVMPDARVGIDARAREELNNLALECHGAGFQLAFHAIEESAVQAVIEALEYMDGRSPVAGRRHRVEHCAECPPRLLERLKKLDAVIVTQPLFIYYSGERYLATVPLGQQPWLYRIKAPLEVGLKVAGSSDAPVVSPDPLKGIYAAATRKAESGQVLLPAEAVSAEQALALYTVNAAYASFEEDVKGAITPGKVADLVILSEDPTTVEPDRIKDIKVEMTLIGGEVLWQA